MKYWIYILFLGLVACTSKSSFKLEDYRGQHQKFNEDHEFFLEQQTKLINNLFDNLLEALEKKEESRFVMGHWEMLQESLQEYITANRIYRTGLINVKETTNIIVDLNTANGELSSEYKVNIAEIEFFIENEKYSAATTFVTRLRDYVKAHMEIIDTKAQKYREIFQSKSR